MNHENHSHPNGEMKNLIATTMRAKTIIITMANTNTIITTTMTKHGS